MPSNPFRLERPEILRTLYISLLSILIGIGAGLIGTLLYRLINFVTNLLYHGEFSWAYSVPTLETVGWWVFGIVALGSVLVAVMSRYISPQVVGQGVAETIETIHANKSRFSPRVLLTKPLASVLSIGTGAPLGAEGPIVQSCAALGSFVGQSLRITPYERKVLLSCGATAGFAASFNTPIAAVIFALELLVLEFRLASFIPLVFAGATGTVVRHALLGGQHQLLSVTVPAGYPEMIPGALLVGLLAGGLAVVMVRATVKLRDLTADLLMQPYVRPVLGGVGVGLIALYVPEVLGLGFKPLNSILQGEFGAGLLLLIILGKSLAWLLTTQAGGAGGSLLPMMLIGAALGGLTGRMLEGVVPSAWVSAELFALVGMAALLGASIRATFTAIIFGFEAVQEFNLIVPLMVGCAVADLVATMFNRDSLVTELLERHGVHVPMEYQADITEEIEVGQVMTTPVISVQASTPIDDFVRRLSDPDDQLYRMQAVPVVNEDNELTGIITRSDLARTGKQQEPGGTVGDYASHDLVTTTPETTVHDAMVELARHDIGRLPVVDPKNPRELRGILSRSDIIHCQMADIEAHTHLESPVYRLFGLGGSRRIEGGSEE